ncbi:response regulator [Bradyrhizobium sp. CCBAU 51627]|uniref:response regulator n=1 Tax=Bradyrhizobium sp. CCBAU 51627 TaxID=1325088 RepID=UPI00230636C7|nr:response regulator [Bradyrhizobium sp. CCBAU 51627]
MVDEFVKVIEAIAKLITAVAWPAVGIYLIYRCGSALRDFLSDMGEGSLKVLGVEASAKRRFANAVATAEIARTAPPNHPPSDFTFWKDVLGKSWQTAELLAGTIPIEETDGKHILWVDDNPDGNIHERHALEALGITVDMAIDTDDAMNKLAERHYDAVISDMARPEGPRAGYELLDRMKAKKISPPFIIYSSTNTPAQQQEAITRGAFGSSNKVAELIELVANAIRSAAPRSKASLGMKKVARLAKAYLAQKGSSD